MNESPQGLLGGQSKLMNGTMVKIKGNEEGLRLGDTTLLPPKKTTQRQNKREKKTREECKGGKECSGKSLRHKHWQGLE